MKVGDLVSFRWDPKQPKKTGVVIKKHPSSMGIAVRGAAYDVLVFHTGRPHRFRAADLEVLNESR